MDYIVDVMPGASHLDFEWGSRLADKQSKAEQSRAKPRKENVSSSRIRKLSAFDKFVEVLQYDIKISDMQESNPQSESF